MKKITKTVIIAIAAIALIVLVIPFYQYKMGYKLSYDEYHGGTIQTCMAIEPRSKKYNQNFFLYAMQWWIIKITKPEWWSIVDTRLYE